MLKITLRTLKGSGKYTVLNIVGLVLGLTLTILIVMLLNYEISYDNFHENTDRILCVGQYDLKDGSFSSTTPYPLPQALKNDFSEVKYVTGFSNVLGAEAEIGFNELTYSGFNGASVDADVFSMFEFKLLLGNKETVLDAPDKIVISKGTAQKIFGKENPVGEILDLQGFHLTVSGIFADLQENSAFNFDILFSEKVNALMWDQAPIAWWAGGVTTFVILNEGVSVAEFDKHLKQIPDKYYPDFLKGRSTYFSTPLKGLHFDTSIHGGLIDAVSPKYLIILGMIAFLTLMIACINFISLSTAQAKRRNIDAGIRRISGAAPFHIVKQHLSFSSVTLLISLLISIPLCSVCIPFFESFVDRELASQYSSPAVWLSLVGLCILLALVSGLIPGLLFSRVKPISTLQGKGGLHKKTMGIRAGFVVFQFTLIISLIISQLFVFKQITDMKNTDLGFDFNQLTAIEVSNLEASYSQKYEKIKVYKAELERHSAKYGFGTGSVSENIPGYYFQNSFTVYPQDAEIDECLVISTAVDENFADLFKIEVLHGRFFSEEYETDRSAFVINETAMRKFGWADIEGKFLAISHEGNQRPVVGVINDITETSLKERANPMIFRFGAHNNFPAYLTYKLDEEGKDAALAFMSNTWNEMFPETPFTYLNVKETYFNNYESEQELAKIIGIFSGFAIFLTILGLLGLISFIADLRTKEIGIRKVNGAKISEVIALLNTDFVKWVGISFLIATPIAWYAMSKWLENFAYKTVLSWWVFLVAGILALGLALLVVSLHSWRTATKNPVEALRYE